MKKTLLLALCILIGDYASSQQSNFLKNLSGFIENTSVFELGQEEGRAYFIPENNQSLNGNWKFFYSDTPEGVPTDFYRPDFDDGSWAEIKVPSNWEMQGYGDKLFRNVSASYSLDRPKNAPPGMLMSLSGAGPRSVFTVTPPEVPGEYNPTGAYRTSFTLPECWAGKQVFLRFEKVASASFVWVNGKEVGYNEGAQEPAEYNITPYLKKGKNIVAVFVVKFSDGYYLEGQDYWRLAGIFDDVWVYAAPPVRIFDWQVITDLDDTYSNADLSVSVEIKNYNAALKNYMLRANLIKDGKVVAALKSRKFSIGGNAKQTIALERKITKPVLWTSETPELYDLSLELLEGSVKVADQAVAQIGFKETEIKGNTFYLNGVPVKLHAINSHMQHPETGHTIDEATIRKDFEILKQFNFNAVRTSHYPPVNKYLELADEFGIFIIDETGDEAHASEYMSAMTEYTAMYRERVQKMVLRDRNHPCVLFWSAGNESGEGSNIEEVIKEGKRLDPTRYWMYGGNSDKHYAEEIVGPRYPSPIELEVNIGLDTVDNRPSFMDEYLAVTGNGGGGLDDYWRVIYSHPRIIGGAIWDFVSPGLSEPVRTLQDKSPFNTPVHIMGNARLVASKSGNAIDLNGHDQWVDIYRADNVEITGDKLTLTLDVFPRSLVSSCGSFITKGNNQFGLQQKGRDALDFYIFAGKKQTLTTKLPANWENSWHNLTAVYDGQTMKIFIDGTETASMKASGSIKNLPYPVNIGRNHELHGDETSVYICDAIIDNVGIFKNAAGPGMELKSTDAALWLDFETEKREGTFYSRGIGARTYGVIFPDRMPQPEMWQMKKSAQPLSFTLLDEDKVIAEVWNRSNFTNASHWKTTWTLTEDDMVLQSGVLDLDVPPQSRKQVVIPCSKPPLVAGKEYRINVSSTLKEDELWAPEGHEVSWDQLELKNVNIPFVPESATPLTVTLAEDKADFIVSGEGFTYRFDRQTGALRSMVYGGSEMLTSPLKLNVWRAPIANEMDSWGGYSMRSNRWKEGYGMTLSTEYYSGGIDNLMYIPLEVRTEEVIGKAVINVREFALVDGGTRNFSQLDMYISGRALSGFESQYEYIITGDGSVTINHTVRPQGNMPALLPRIGLTLSLAGNLENVEWYGRGPQENYPDRKSGYPVGIYQSTVKDMYVSYLIPQDYGLRTDNKWLRMTDDKGRGLEFRMDEYFNFNAYPFTTDNLTKALYTFNLRESGNVTLNLDYATTGLGCTARPVMASYRVYPQAISRQITIKPLP